ncbi:MAG: Gfo/Idh/MocA family oxidoreductase [Pirellulales bacterium]
MTTAERRSDESRALRMAVIGCGPVGTLHAQAIAASPHAVLVAVCEVDPQRRDEAQRRFDVHAYERVERLLTDESLDAVAIATPDHLHLQPALEAIAAGCHVFCEKPLANSVPEAGQIVRAAAERNVRLGVDYNRRFAFGYRTAKRLVDEGAIGTVRHSRLTVSDRTPPPRVARHPLVIFTTLLTHHFDLLRCFAGEVRSIRAEAGQPTIGSLLRNVTLSFEFAGGAQGTIVAGYRDELTRTVESLDLGGTVGTIVVEDVTGPVTWTSRDGQSTQSFSAQDHGGEETFYDSLIAHVQAFIEHVARGAAPPVTGEDGLVGMRLAAAAIESIESGTTIEVEASLAGEGEAPAL